MPRDPQGEGRAGAETRASDGWWGFALLGPVLSGKPRAEPVVPPAAEGAAQGRWALAEACGASAARGSPRQRLSWEPAAARGRVVAASPRRLLAFHRDFAFAG